MGPVCGGLLGSFCGDQVFFFLGRRYGTRIIARFPRLEPRLNKVFGLLEKYATAFVLSYRFMYGVRNISGLAIGMSKLPWRRFVWLNAIAAALWAAAFCGAGYLFGDVIEHLSRRKEEIEDKVNWGVREFMLVVLALAIFAIIMRLLFLRWQRKRIERRDAMDRAALEADDKTPL